jgi:hypothetical protein
MGRPAKVTQEMKDLAVSMTANNGGLSRAAVAEVIERNMNVKVRRIRHEFSFLWGLAKRCPLLTDDHVCGRMQFVRDFSGPMFQELKTLPFVFTDECRFCCRPDNKWVWKRRGEYSFATLAPVAKFAKISIMIWAAIGPNFKSSLAVHNGLVNSETYMQALQDGFSTEADEKYGDGRWVFVQDGASCHTTEYSITELSRRCQLCPTWPANSPDLDPTENQWSVIKLRIQWSLIETREQAIVKIREIWDSLDMKIITGLCASFSARVELMAKADGQTIQPLLSARRLEVPLGYLSDRPNIVLPQPWTVAHDALLWQAMDQLWWTISRSATMFPYRSFNSVQCRWRILRILRAMEAARRERMEAENATRPNT